MSTSSATTGWFRAPCSPASPRATSGSGTFQYAAATGDEALRPPTGRPRHRPPPPRCRDANANPYLGLLQAVIGAQAELVARWMLVGFIHGVMNTDNITISGETIDYGPCAFMDAFDPATVFSSIDHGGRYAYGNQPAIAQWNLARLAETLLPLIDDDEDAAVAAATEVLRAFPDRYNDAPGPPGCGPSSACPTSGPATTSSWRDLLGLLQSQAIDLTLGVPLALRRRARRRRAGP